MSNVNILSGKLPAGNIAELPVYKPSVKLVQTGIHQTIFYGVRPLAVVKDNTFHKTPLASHLGELATYIRKTLKGYDVRIPKHAPEVWLVGDSGEFYVRFLMSGTTTEVWSVTMKNEQRAKFGLAPTDGPYNNSGPSI